MNKRNIRRDKTKSKGSPVEKYEDPKRWLMAVAERCFALLRGRATDKTDLFGAAEELKRQASEQHLAPRLALIRYPFLFAVRQLAARNRLDALGATEAAQAKEDRESYLEFAAIVVALDRSVSKRKKVIHRRVASLAPVDPGFSQKAESRDVCVEALELAREFMAKLLVSMFWEQDDTFVLDEPDLEKIFAMMADELKRHDGDARELVALLLSRDVDADNKDRSKEEKKKVVDRFWQWVDVRTANSERIKPELNALVQLFSSALRGLTAERGSGELASGPSRGPLEAASRFDEIDSPTAQGKKA